MHRPYRIRDSRVPLHLDPFGKSADVMPRDSFWPRRNLAATLQCASGLWDKANLLTFSYMHVSDTNL
jgi:hypothetical protein